jgi:tetratricopeptide (TPR) repeat protein
MDHGQCLAEETLTDYLEGGLDPAIRAASEVHLVACDNCRLKLGFYMRLLDEEISPDETNTIQLVTAEWEKKRKDRMPRRTGTWRSWLLPGAAVAATLILGLVSVWSVAGRVRNPDSASDVVQLLLAQQRPFEVQLSNQPHLPILRTRGTEDPGVSYGLLAGELTRLSADSHQMGRFYLVQKDFKRAIDYLELAEKEVGASAEIHNDLGVAYLEGGGESRLQRAAQEFRHALQKDPSFAPAVFNQAVFYERTGATAEAESQWQRYLQLDSNSAWSVEARTRLQNLSR